MCDFGAGIALFSSLLGAVGGIQQARAQSDAAKYNAKVGEMNATLADRRAKDALERGKIEEQRKRQEVSQIKGRQKAAMAANGLDIGFGSPLDTIVDTATLGELDALTIRTNSAREAYDNNVDAENRRAGATLDRMSARSALQGGYLSAAGTVLTGFGNAYSGYKQRTAGAY